MINHLSIIFKFLLRFIMSIIRNQYESKVNNLEDKLNLLGEKVDDVQQDIGGVKQDIKNLKQLLVVMLISSGLIGKIPLDLVKSIVGTTLEPTIQVSEKNAD